MKFRSSIAALLFAVSFGRAAPALAQIEALDNKELKKRALAGTSTTAPDGWKVALNFGGTANFSFSNETAAAAGAGEEGSTFQIGIVVGLTGDYKSGPHRWQNKLTVQQTQTKQPARNFRKSLDSLELMSTYLYSFERPSWAGPFARLRLNTQILRSSYFNDDGAAGWVRESIGPGGPQNERNAFEVVGSEQRVVQTEPFEPLLFRESVGFVAQPFSGPGFTFDAKLGVGAQQVIARDGITFVELREIQGAPTAVFREIEQSTNLGGEGEFEMTGILVADRLTWRLTANVFIPFVASGEVITDSGPNPTEAPVGLEYANVDIVGGVALQLAKWASLNYVLTVRRVPVVVRGLQVQHGILLSAGFELL